MPNVKAPAGLGTKARRVWRGIIEEFDLRADELRILEDACREVDLIERLEGALGELKDDKETLKNPLVVKGSMGQPVASPIVQEIRQHRATLKSLFAALKLPEGDESAAAARTVRARAAATARWRAGARS